MVNPALQPGKLRMGQGKGSVELDCAFEEPFRPQHVVHQFVRPLDVFARLHVKQISLPVLRGFAFDLRFLVGRKFRFQDRGDFIRQLTLDREDIRQIAVVILRSDVLVI